MKNLFSWKHSLRIDEGHTLGNGDRVHRPAMIPGERSKRVGVDRLDQVEGEQSREIRRFAHQIVHPTYGHVILQIAAHSSRVVDHGYVQLSQMILRSYPGHH